MNDIIKLENLTPTQIEMIKKAVLIDDLKEQFVKSRKEVNFDLDKQVSNWMRTLNSVHTIRMYKLVLNRFLNHINRSVLSISVEDADGYIVDLKNHYKAGKTVMLHIHALSSFYCHLKRYGCINMNPFHGSKVRVDKSSVRKKYVPTSNDIAILMNAFEKTASSKKMVLALHIMKKYGVRKGFLDNMVYNGRYLQSISKGKEYKVAVHEEDLKYFEDNQELLSQLNSNSVSSTFNRTVNKLYNSGKITKKFSPHCIRHRFAIDFYDKSNHDTMRLMNALNHTSLNATQNYLAELGK